MIRHISIFILKKEEETMQQKHARELVKLLEELPDEIPEILHCNVGMNASIPPKELSKAAPVFGEVVQIIDFESQDTARQYPSHPAHIRLVQRSKKWIAQVTAIDFEM